MLYSQEEILPQHIKWISIDINSRLLHTFALTCEHAYTLCVNQKDTFLAFLPVNYSLNLHVYFDGFFAADGDWYGSKSLLANTTSEQLFKKRFAILMFFFRFSLYFVSEYFAYMHICVPCACSV